MAKKNLPSPQPSPADAGESNRPVVTRSFPHQRARVKSSKEIQTASEQAAPDGIASGNENTLPSKSIASPPQVSAGACKSFPHPRSLSRGERDEKPFSPREKGGDEGSGGTITQEPNHHLGPLDLHLIAEGRHHNLDRALGAQPFDIDGKQGVRFAVWAPNARRVAVIGDFNGWNPDADPMHKHEQGGVWETFIADVPLGARYKYALIGVDGDRLPDKADPLARQTEMPPGTASIVASSAPYKWNDARWMQQRGARQSAQAPLSIYEVHAGSWFGQAGVDGWRSLSQRLIPYVKAMGFTHIELLPIMEHPFGGSWGYQPLGLFAPTARFGTPADFASFVDACHAAEIGVILDWVPAHFPNDAHGLARFDGTALYEYNDPREGFHRDWNTLIYNLARHEVRGFVIASALLWLERFHVDGLRVDAVASMLYRDYSRNAGEWLPNVHGGRENLEAVAFLRELNTVVHERCRGAITIAEESTAWPGVTQRVEDGGLGFDFKWNMGWMHDTLRYMAHEPVHRRHHHNDLSFGLVYAFSEKFVLPISHDEVVHGKGSLFTRMPGGWDELQRFANLRAYLGFMYTHPGKKLLFMGCEFGQRHEWNHDASIDWNALDDPRHRGVQRLVRDLNRLYVDDPALHRADAEPNGFQWIVGDDAEQSVFAYLRHGGFGLPSLLVIVNMTPVARHGYRIGVPVAGVWAEVLNTDAEVYGGGNQGNGGGAATEDIAAHGQAQSLALHLPPLATIVLRMPVNRMNDSTTKKFPPLEGKGAKPASPKEIAMSTSTTNPSTDVPADDEYFSTATAKAITPEADSDTEAGAPATQPYSSTATAAAITADETDQPEDKSKRP